MKYDMRRFFEERLLHGIQRITAVHPYGVNGKISGNLAALIEIEDCVPILHGPIGCAFHYRRSMRTDTPVYALESTHLQDSDVIFGGEEKLRGVLQRVAARKPALIAVLPTSVADVLQEDIEGVVRAFRANLTQYDAPRIIAVRSAAFSHPDKHSSVAQLRERAYGKGRSCGNETKAEFAGCGFIEVMDALVDQVMQPQERAEGTVNIETFAWGYHGAHRVQSAVDTLRAIGIETNTLLPTATCAQIAAAPRAALNVVRRVRWARHMRDVFGTPYLHLSNMNDWHGSSGIRAFYLTIAEAMGKKTAAERVLAKEESRIAQDVREIKAYLGKFRYGLISASFSMIPELISIYENDYNMKLDFVALILPDDYGRIRGLDDATMTQMHENIRAEMRRTAPHAAFCLNPSASELARLVQGVDCPVGGDGQRYEQMGTPWIPDMNDMRAFSMRDYKDVLALIAQAV